MVLDGCYGSMVHYMCNDLMDYRVAYSDWPGTIAEYSSLKSNVWLFYISERKATAIDLFPEDLPNGDISVPVSTVSLPDYTSYHNSLNPFGNMTLSPKLTMPSSQPPTIQYTLGKH